MNPATTHHVKIRKYKHPSGGWGSLKSLIRKARGEGLLMSGIWSTLLKQNKADGYMCVSCSWAKPAEPRPFEFCENGAKATIWDPDDAALWPGVLRGAFRQRIAPLARPRS